MSFDFYDNVFCRAGILDFYEVRVPFMFTGFRDIVRSLLPLVLFFFKETNNLSFRPRRQRCMDCCRLAPGSLGVAVSWGEGTATLEGVGGPRTRQMEWQTQALEAMHQPPFCGCPMAQVPVASLPSALWCQHRRAWLYWGQTRG